VFAASGNPDSAGAPRDGHLRGLAYPAAPARRADKAGGNLPGCLPDAVAVALLTFSNGTLRAVAPDLDHCDLTGTTEEELLPRLRLAIESEMTRVLLAGAALPESRVLQPAPGFGANNSGSGPVRWLTVHINLAHLKALARHQSRYKDGR
jgi:hypothetical protein